MTSERERVDRIPGDPAATAWREGARRHQSAWRERHGWPEGAQALPGGRGTRPIGSRVDEESGRASVNFLNDAVRRAVQYRLDAPQKHQTLDERRLRCDLLSSMPMCFNLFGPLWGDPELASVLTSRWFPDLCPAGAAVQVDFEWSPGRADDRWLGDRTAFDAVLRIDVDGDQRLVGVETKYHEYPITVPVAPARRDGRSRAARDIKQRYREVASKAGMFDSPDAVDRLWGTDLEQVWRDHLLALACQQENVSISATRYVLVAPAMNPPWAALSARYAAILSTSARSTFEYRSLEQLIDAARDVAPHLGEFSRRYLDVQLDVDHRSAAPSQRVARTDDAT